MEKMVPIRPFFEVLAEIQYQLGDQNPAIMAKVGRSLGEKWAKELRNRPKTVRELFDMVATYLQDQLLFAEKVDVIQDENNYILKFGMPNLDNPTEDCRCILCCGNIVKQKGGVPACPMSGFVQGAYRVLKRDIEIKGIQLKEIRKPGPEIGPGVCDQHYIVTPRPKALTKEDLAKKIAERQVTVDDITPFHRLLVEFANESNLIQQHTKDWKHSIEIRVDEGPTGWIKSDNGKFSFGEGHCDYEPDLVLELDRDTILGILGGTSATQAYEAGAIKIHGRFRDAVKFQRILETVRKELLALV